MAYPQTILDLLAELLLGTAWTDISTWLYQRNPPAVTITRGHPDETVVTTPTAMATELNNRDGRFCDKNPTGPYYGSLMRNVPIRISVPEGASYLRSETDQSSGATAPDAAGLDITGDTEVQLDVTLDNWAADQALAGKWLAAGSQRSWLLTLNETGTLSFRWSPDGTNSNSVVAVSGATVPVPGLNRQALRVTLAVATGTVTFYTAPAAADQVTLGPITSGWVQLGAPVVLGADNVFSSTAPVSAGFVAGAAADYAAWTGIYGKVHRLALLSGIGGTVKASPDFTAQTAGAASFADAQGNTWTVQGTAEISTRRYRAHCECSGWPQTWDPSGTDVYVSLQASGLLRRLQQGNSPLKSAMYRYWTKLTGSSAPVAYWPCEDLAGATQLASANGGRPMLFSGSPTLASFTGFACSAALPVLNGSVWTGAIAPYSSGSDNVLSFLLALPAAGDASGFVASLYGIGKVARMDLAYTNASGGLLYAEGYDASGNSLFNSNVLTGANGGQYMARLALQNSGANVVWTAELLTPGGAAVTSATGSVTTAATGQMKTVVINLQGGLVSTVVGHIAVQSVFADLSGLAGISALNSWAGEAAGVRFGRLCAEEGIAFRGVGRLSASVPMGPMTQQTLMADLQEVADADRGVIFEPRQVLGLGYKTLSSLENQQPAVALSYTHQDLAGTPGLKPVTDDQTTVNDVTVTRTGGSSSRQVMQPPGTAGAAFTGPLNTNAPNATPPGVGLYDTQVQISLGSDSQVDSEAGWLVRMGTVNEPRYPVIPVDLARPAVAGVFCDLQELDLGQRITVSAPPAWLPPDGISQIVQGVTERLGGYIFQIDFCGVPESPYEVLVLDDPVHGRLDTDGCTLHASISSSATSLGADTAAGFPLWTTAAGDFPFDIQMAGERMTVTNITGTSGTQTFTVVRSVNGVVKAQAAGTAFSLFFTPILALA